MARLTRARGRGLRSSNLVGCDPKVSLIPPNGLEVRDRRAAGLIAPTTAHRKARELTARIVRLTEPIKTHRANERLAAHLYRNQDHLFTFLRHQGIDATNRRVEQMIRPAVVNRKMWGGNRTQAGADAQSILMSVWQTMARLRQIDPLRWLSDLLRSPISAPLLLLVPSG
ncbi:MAG: transposase [Phycisphaerales bacterium]|nr:transposase [Phycisphaerales bacterium]